MPSQRSLRILRRQSRCTSRITTFARFMVQSVARRLKLPVSIKAFGPWRNLSNAVANSPYIQSLQAVIRRLHGCDSAHVESVSVHEIFRGETIWQGDVEVFDLAGHPKAKRAYAWGERKNMSDPGAKFVAVLEVHPVVSPKTAVQVAIVGEIKGKDK